MMIYNRAEYELEVKAVKGQLALLAVYKVNNQEVKSLDDIEAIKSFYNSYTRILDMIENLFEDPAFKSIYSSATDE